MSKLEKFIDNNREQFDDDLPSAKVWDNIEVALVAKENKKAAIAPLFKWSIAAAAVLAILSVAYFQFTGKESIKAAVTAETEINKMVPEYAPQVNEFARMINLKQEELKQLSKEQPALYNTFTKDITQLDSSYTSLKKQFSTSANKELLVEAMIQNLQLQLQVLNQQLNIIHEIKETKNYNHEKNSQTI